ncbi:hypothetical protein ACFOWT_08330 [Croceibacterium xixiisoli]|nr:hypothetical protein [Croceibacterium xixiisoli]
MVRALLDGRKTQTRRLINPQPPGCVTSAGVIARTGQGQTDEWSWLSGDPADMDSWGFEGEFKARYRPGDRLYVREAWAPLSACTHNDPGSQAAADNGFYKADDSTVEGEIDRWRPSIHMPRSASRMTLQVSEVRVQRLQDISEEDALAEGIGQYGRFFGLPDADWDAAELTAQAAFQRVWSSLHTAPGTTWDDNPWIVVVTFEVIKGNIDALPAREAEAA